MLTTLFSDNYEGIAGYHFFHYGSCPTRLWLFHRNVEVGLDNDHIRIGKHLDEITHIRNKKRLVIPGLCSIDYLEKGDSLEIHEIKKGDKISDAHKYQVLYYLEVVSDITGMKIKGFIHYPTVKKVVEVERNTELIEKTYHEIYSLISGPCPSPERIPICRGCSYAEMCWA